SSRANLLNEQNITTIIRENGYRLWGNRTLSSDTKFAFLSVVRTADMINDAILRGHLWAVDRNIKKTYMSDVSESVNAYLRDLKAQGAILGGRCTPDLELNTASAIESGRVYFNVEFTPTTPAEHITFRSRIVNDYLEEIF
ncbi:phage tail sheath family protein, partial [Bartonella sp. CL100XZDX]|uniref:phage tail sheath family protein n=2 Tax=unclassified Bartonella TaxID=2645622 RepID=UPI0035CFA8F5